MLLQMFLFLNYLVLTVHVFLSDAEASSEIDLLGAIGVPSDGRPGIGYDTGIDGYPTFTLSKEAFIRQPAQIYFRKPLYRDFAVVMTLKPYTQNGGFIFAVVNTYQTVIQFGVSITDSPREPTKQVITLYYTPDAKFAEISSVIASFTVDSTVNKWTKIALRVEEDTITLYLNCKESEKVFYNRKSGELDFEPGSSVFIAQAGPNFKSKFEVSTNVAL